MAKIRLVWNQKTFEKDLDKEIRQRLVNVGAFLEADIKKSLSRGNKDGKSPSKPGEPPKTVTGALLNSVGFEMDKKMPKVKIGIRKGLTTTKSTGAPQDADSYARMLEFGTRKMAPRPYLRPALKKNRKNILDIIGD